MLSNWRRKRQTARSEVPQNLRQANPETTDKAMHDKEREIALSHKNTFFFDSYFIDRVF